jgi:hypothetical protein
MTVREDKTVAWCSVKGGWGLERRPVLARILREAKKAGAAAVTYEGVTVRFDQPPAPPPEVNAEESPRSLFKTRERPKVRVVL